MEKQQLLEMISTLQQMSGLSALPTYGQLENIRERLMTQEFRVVVIGEFSSGKSTFINALLHKDLLSHSKNETTAAITRLVNTPAESEKCQTCEVVFADGRTQVMADLSELMEYTTTESSRTNVVQEIREVRLFVPIEGIDPSLTIIDTPGINGIADGHRERTIEEVQHAHACIYLLQLRGLDLSDIGFLRVLSQYQSQFLFVQNFIDEIKAMEQDPLENKLLELRQLLREKVFYDQPQAAFEVCGISALKALVHYDRSIERLYEFDSGVIAPEEREALLEESGILSFYGALQKLFPPRKLAGLQCASGATALLHWLGDTHDLLSVYGERNENTRRYNRDGAQHKALSEILARVKENADRNTEKISNFILSERANDRRILEERMDARLKEISDTLTEELSSISSVELLEQKWAPSQVNRWLSHQNYKLGQELKADYTVAMEYLADHIIARIEEYSGIGCEALHFEVKQEGLLLNDVRLKSVDTSGEKGRLRQMDEKLRELERGQKQSEKELTLTLSQIKTESQQQEGLANQLQGRKKAYQRSLAQKGSRPVQKAYPYTWQEEVERGGFGIIDKLFGPKLISHTAYRYDDSEGEAWDLELQTLNSNYDLEKKKNERLRGAAAERLQRAVSDYESKKNEPERLRAKIKNLQQDMKAQEDYIRTVEENARREYLALRKKQIYGAVHSTLETGADSIRRQVQQALDHALTRGCESMRKQAVKYLQEVTEGKIRQLQEAVSGKEERLREQYPDYGNEMKWMEEAEEKIREEMVR